MLLLKRMQDNEIIHSTLFLSIGKPHSNNKFTVMYLLLNKKTCKKMSHVIPTNLHLVITVSDWQARRRIFEFDRLLINICSVDIYNLT